MTKRARMPQERLEGLETPAPGQTMLQCAAMRALGRNLTWTQPRFGTLGGGL